MKESKSNLESEQTTSSESERKTAKSSEKGAGDSPTELLHQSVGNQALQRLYTESWTDSEGENTNEGFFKSSAAPSKPSDPARLFDTLGVHRSEESAPSSHEFGAAKSGDTTVSPKQIAALGTSGSGSKLPHYHKIQRSFGSHDLSTVDAYTGEAARTASTDLNAEAYTVGDSIAFRDRSPSLETAAHEAAHVIQQRSGVQLRGDLDQPGDLYEQHAEIVAARLVSGESVESLLNTGPAGGEAVIRGGTIAMSSPVQRQTEATAREASGDESGPSVETESSLETSTEQTVYADADLHIKIRKREDSAVVLVTISLSAGGDATVTGEGSYGKGSGSGEAEFTMSGEAMLNVKRVFEGVEPARDYAARLQGAYESGEGASSDSEGFDEFNIVADLESDIASNIGAIREQLKRIAGGAKTMTPGERSRIFLSAEVGGKLAGEFERLKAVLGVNLGLSRSFHREVIVEGIEQQDLKGNAAKITIEFYDTSKTAGGVTLNWGAAAGGGTAESEQQSKETYTFVLPQNIPNFQEEYLDIVTNSLDPQRTRSLVARSEYAKRLEEASQQDREQTASWWGLEFFWGESSEEELSVEDTTKYEGEGGQTQGARLESGDTSTGLGGSETKAKVTAEQNKISTILQKSEYDLWSSGTRQLFHELGPSEMERVMARAENKQEWKRFVKQPDVQEPWLTLRRGLTSPTRDPKIINVLTNNGVARERASEWAAKVGAARSIRKFFEETGRSGQSVFQQMVSEWGSGGGIAGEYKPKFDMGEYSEFPGSLGFSREHIKQIEEAAGTLFERNALYPEGGRTRELFNHIMYGGQLDLEPEFGIMELLRKIAACEDFSNQRAQFSMIANLNEIRAEIAARVGYGADDIQTARFTRVHVRIDTIRRFQDAHRKQLNYVIDHASDLFGATGVTDIPGSPAYAEWERQLEELMKTRDIVELDTPLEDLTPDFGLLAEANREIGRGQFVRPGGLENVYHPEFILEEYFADYVDAGKVRSQIQRVRGGKTIRRAPEETGLAAEEASPEEQAKQMAAKTPGWSGTEIPPPETRRRLKQEAKKARETENPRRDQNVLESVKAGNPVFDRVIIGSGFAAVLNIGTLGLASDTSHNIIAIGEGEPWAAYHEKAMGQTPALLSPGGIKRPATHFMDPGEDPMNVRYLSSDAFADAIAWNRDAYGLSVLDAAATRILPKKQTDGEY